MTGQRHGGPAVAGHRRRAKARRLAAVLPALLLGPALAASAAPVPPPAVYHIASLSAATATLTGTAYDGIETLDVAGVEVDTLKLTMASATLGDLAVTVPCTPLAAGSATGISVGITTPSGSESTAPEGMTLWATSVTGTTPLGKTTWTPENPPPARTLGTLALSGLEVSFVTADLPSLQVPDLRQAATFCAP